MKDKIKQAAQAYYPKGTLREVDKVAGFVRGANWAVDTIKPIIHKFLREHDFVDYLEAITSDNQLIYNYNKFESDLLKSIEDGY